mgnify:CR=1 FL=1|tara:strand:+ start:14150 stop:14440 length:291 start_codon:yes stop_codon:yes gene_type:complete
MDWLKILDTYGVSVVVAIAFGYFIWKQNRFIQNDLTKDIHNKFNRLEKINIKLIDQQKKMQLDLKRNHTEIATVIDVMAAFTGNGLKDKINKTRRK